MGQVALIEELLSWVLEGVPDGCRPLLLADRGLGTSPDLFRVQGQTRFQLPDGQSIALRDVVSPGGTWTRQGKLFKTAGWLDAIAHVLWETPYRQAWCLVTHCPHMTGRQYAQRYWQEASFRDLKSDGWQWHSVRLFTPAHANLLLLASSPWAHSPLTNPAWLHKSWTKPARSFGMAGVSGKLSGVACLPMSWP